MCVGRRRYPSERGYPSMSLKPSDLPLHLAERISALSDRAPAPRGEFVLYYQAKCDAAYHTVVGAEGLVRWHDTRNEEVVLPGAFIEVAEQSATRRQTTGWRGRVSPRSLSADRRGE